MVLKISNKNSTRTGTKMIQTSRPVRWAGLASKQARHIDRRRIPDMPRHHWPKRSLTQDVPKTGVNIRTVISQDLFYKSSFASKISWKKRSSLYCVQTSSFLFVGMWRVCKSSKIKHPGGFVLQTKERSRPADPFSRMFYFCQVTPLKYEPMVMGAQSLQVVFVGAPFGSSMVVLALNSSGIFPAVSHRLKTVASYSMLRLAMSLKKIQSGPAAPFFFIFVRANLTSSGLLGRAAHLLCDLLFGYG